jgi:hypothetical protein
MDFLGVRREFGSRCGVAAALEEALLADPLVDGPSLTFSHGRPRDNNAVANGVCDIW